MEYEAMLERAFKELPEKNKESERFEIPKIKGHLEGNKTILTNFFQICALFRREPSQLLKYLQRELATPAQFDGQRLVLGRKISSSLINDKIDAYAKDFVLCKECGKPDSQLGKEGKVLTFKCLACSAKYPIRAKI